MRVLLGKRPAPARVLGLLLALALLPASVAPTRGYGVGKSAYGGTERPARLPHLPHHEASSAASRREDGEADRSSSPPHHSRYSSLEHLLLRLGSSVFGTLAPSQAATTPAPAASSRASSRGFHEPPDSYEDDYEDFDEDMDDEDIDDADEDIDDRSSWDLLEGSHPEDIPSDNEHKWDTLSTTTGDELRRWRVGSSGLRTTHTIPRYAEAAEAVEAVNHLLRVNREGDCKVPKPRLVQVKNKYPHPSKIYFPRCTILHQCGDDTGCCNAESLTCVPRYTHRVELFFYTTTVGSTPSSPQGVERLFFYNHTECACEDRNSWLLLQDRDHILQTGNRGFFQGPQQHRSSHSMARNSCRCTSKYSVRPGNDMSCTCDCFDKQRDCLRLKKGKEYFSTHDRQCIQKGECKLPSCEFGSYLRLAGRCPKKREGFDIHKT